MKGGDPQGKMQSKANGFGTLVGIASDVSKGRFSRLCNHLILQTCFSLFQLAPKDAI
jgi:hypothetical protein